MSQVGPHALGYWEIQPRPSKEELAAYYSHQYFQQAKGSYELVYGDKERAWIEAKSRLRVAIVEGHLGGGLTIGKPRAVLDIGCGEGFGLDAFQRAGWRIRGLDHSVAGVRAQNPHVEPFLAAGDVGDLMAAELASGNRYECITLINVLEHVLDPVSLLASAHDLLQPEGIFVVTVPNDFSELQALARAEGCANRDYWVAPPDHLQYFDRCSLGRIAEATGWVVADLLGDFPIEWFLFHPGSNYMTDPALGKGAHRARISLELQALSGTAQDAASFQRGLAAVGMCRNITAILVSKDTIRASRSGR
jgi:2-polyprenyl-3-methyl-5-hydroxy-6-metoxy-1,4-benzoquinol methylase